MMGRLLRKKDPGKKLKKERPTGEVGQSQNSPAVQGATQPIDKGFQFLREVKVELKKVTWPSRKQTMGSTVVVLVIVTIISLFLGLVDAGLSGLVRAVLQ